MKALNFMRVMADTLGDLELEPVGVVPIGTDKFRLQYQVTGQKLGATLVKSSVTENVQLTLIAKRNTAQGVTALSDKIQSIWDYILNYTSPDVVLMLKGDPIEMNYMGDNFLPSYLLNFGIKYYR